MIKMEENSEPTFELDEDLEEDTLTAEELENLIDYSSLEEFKKAKENNET